MGGYIFEVEVIYGSYVGGFIHHSSVMERYITRILLSVLDYLLGGHVVRLHVVRLHMDPLGPWSLAWYNIIWVQETWLVDFLMFFNVVTYIVWVLGEASSNSRLYMDYALEFLDITLVLWNATREFFCCVFSTINQGACSMSAYGTSTYGFVGQAFISSMLYRMGMRDTTCWFSFVLLHQTLHRMGAGGCVFKLVVIYRSCVGGFRP